MNFTNVTNPHWFLHVDGDAFFASCEMAKNPALKGKPIVVGQERRIATAVSYEAKALGVIRGMTMRHIRSNFPQVIIVSSDYENYGLFTKKMYAIVRRYSDVVEEYSIDECFADITDLVKEYKDLETRNTKIIETGQTIKLTLEKELDLSFSVGIGPTKVLAKVASKWNKPSGFTFIANTEIENYLGKLPVKKVWGIGSSTAYHLKKLGIETTLQFTQQSEQWLNHYVPKPIHEIWYELRGVSVYKINTNLEHIYKSISKTGTFRPTYDKKLLFSELSKNIERMCHKLRRHKLRTKKFSFFIKTQEFSYYGGEVTLSNSMAIPTEMITLLKKPFEKVYKPGTLYRATGVTATSIIDEEHSVRDIFGNFKRIDFIDELFKINDTIIQKLGRGSVFLASSLQSLNESHKYATKKPRELPRFTIPYLGEVT